MAKLLGFEVPYTHLSPAERKHSQALAFLGIDEKDTYTFTAKNQLDRAACSRIFQALTKCCKANGKLAEANMNVGLVEYGDEEAETVRKAKKAYERALGTLRETVEQYEDLRIDGKNVEDLFNWKEASPPSPVQWDD